MPAKFIPAKVSGKPSTEKNKFEYEFLRKIAAGVIELNVSFNGSKR